MKTTTTLSLAGAMLLGLAGCAQDGMTGNSAMRSDGAPMQCSPGMQCGMGMGGGPGMSGNMAMKDGMGMPGQSGVRGGMGPDMMKMMDTNGDGMVSKEEFMKHHEMMFDKMKGSNGMVSLQDMQKMQGGMMGR